jgi:hypothetical protein
MSLEVDQPRVRPVVLTGAGEGELAIVAELVEASGDAGGRRV